MAIAQFVNGLITKLKLNELVDGINANSTELDKVILLSADVTKTVGTGGDFTTLNEAINWCKKVVPNGHIVALNLLSGFVMAEQILLENVDLGFVTISSIDTEVVVDKNSISVIKGVSMALRKPVFYGYYSKLPNINTIFNMNGIVDDAYKDGVFIEYNSYIKINENKGFKNISGSGVRINVGSFASVRESILTARETVISVGFNSNVYAVLSKLTALSSSPVVSCSYSSQANVVLAELTANNAINGLSVRNNSNADFTSGIVSGSVISSWVSVEDGSFVTISNDSTFSLSQTANTLTANGIIFK